MEHITAFMFLVGCGQGDICKEVAAPQVAFETMEDCRAALPHALGGAGSGGLVVHGRCAAFDPAWEEGDVEINWKMTTSRRLEIDIRYLDPNENVILAGNDYPASASAH